LLKLSHEADQRILPDMKKAKHKEIEAEIRHLISMYPVGAKLPPERQLAASHSCNCLTVRTAMKTLVDEGIIVRRVGSGTFVASRGDLSTGLDGATKNARIGVLVHSDSDAYAHKLLQGMAQVAADMGVTLRTGWVRDFQDDGLQQAHQLKQEGCAAVVLPWFPHGSTAEVRAFVGRSPLPVSLPLVIPGLEKNYFGEASTYGLDLLSTTEALCRYFQALGRTHIALLGPQSPGDSILQMMLVSYMCHMARERLPCLCGLVTPTSQSMDQLARDWKQYAGTLAIVSYDDEHALRLLTSMHKLGLNAPQDFCIVGHNDTGASRFSDPPLSTIRQDFTVIGRGLLRSAVALSRNTEEHDNSSAPTKLMVRESCGGRGKITEAIELLLPALRMIEEPLMSASLVPQN
jgi:DNA-binding LacI/PurR family transcriptional regulator